MPKPHTRKKASEGQAAPDSEAVLGSAPPKPRTRKKASEGQSTAKPRSSKARAANTSTNLPPPAEDIAVHLAPQPTATPPLTNNGEVRIPSTPIELPPAADDVKVRTTTQTTPPTPAAPFWGTQPSGSLYEVDLEVRNQAHHDPSHTTAISDVAISLLQLISENMRRMTEHQVANVNKMLSSFDLNDYIDPNFWKGIGIVLQYQIEEQVAFVKRRMRGEYSVDAYGMDYEIIEVVRPFVSFMYRTWWRVTSYGLEHVPAEGRALLVANHSGVLPWDGAMISSAVASDHPVRPDRVVRSLHLHWFSTLPFIAPALAATGQVPGLPENAVRLLENDELVCVFPEGLKGVGKLYKDRYKLARFG
ncbi:MAG: hypothetical protein HGA19_09240, partial [Oscillochloris sp.]|nr:hypothetical protein [Oscillochloris sp.]